MERFERSTNPRALFWGLEPHKSGLHHVHGLVRVGPIMNDAHREDAWNELRKELLHFGRCDVQHFDPELGAAHYVSKYVTKRLTDWDVKILT